MVSDLTVSFRGGNGGNFDFDDVRICWLFVGAEIMASIGCPRCGGRGGGIGADTERVLESLRAKVEAGDDNKEFSESFEGEWIDPGFLLGGF
jgi:hypothetical protein